MNQVFSRFALVLACTLASSAVACADPGTTDGDVASADETSAKLESGTYKLQGEPEAWTIKQLILRDDSTYTVEMYPGRAFPIDFTKVTEGKYVQTANKLTIKFAKGNDFNSWTIVKVGKKLELTDTEEGNTFTLKLDSKSTVFDPGPVQGVDPGMPRKAANQAAIACHSSQADIYFNAVVALDGSGKAWVTSAKELELGDTVDKITLVNDLPEEDTTEWVHPAGSGKAGYEPHRYVMNVTTDFIRNGGQDIDVSIALGSAEYESDPYVSWGFVCSSDGI